MRHLMMVTLMLSTGCTVLQGKGKWDGIWFLSIPQSEDLDCDESITHNFSDAGLPDEVEFESDWEYTFETDRSNSGLFAQVIQGRGGEAFVIIGDVIYPGTADGKTLTVEWTSFEDVADDELNEGANYLFSERISREQVETITLTWDKEVTGTVAISTNSTLDWTESDRWNAAEVGFDGGQIPASSYLVSEEGFVFNSGEESDCDDTGCELVVSQDCSGTTPFTATWAGPHEDGLFGAIEDSVRPGGVSGGGYYP